MNPDNAADEFEVYGKHYLKCDAITKILVSMAVLLPTLCFSATIFK